MGLVALGDTDSPGWIARPRALRVVPVGLLAVGASAASAVLAAHCCSELAVRVVPAALAAWAGAGALVGPASA
ncbi:hypothetical protein BHQ23_30600 [Mycobacterium gordonae]|nr:hypothetical protein BHQ23_30600 [Mycobacterium gordonae]